MMATNTIVVYDLPKARIGTIAQDLEQLGIPGLRRLVPVTFLRRLMLVFDSILHAEQAMHLLRSTLDEVCACCTARVGYTIESNSPSLAQEHLKLPDPGTLLFISPPPSPPLQWEEFEEEEPNTRTHFEAELNEKLQLALEQQQQQHQQQQHQQPEMGTPVSAVDSPRTVMIMEASSSAPALHVTHDA